MVESENACTFQLEFFNCCVVCAFVILNYFNLCVMRM